MKINDILAQLTIERCELLVALQEARNEVNNLREKISELEGELYNTEAES